MDDETAPKESADGSINPSISPEPGTDTGPVFQAESNETINRSPESIWGCPCGWTGRYNSLVGHRKGYKKRPACAGKIFAVTGPMAPPAPEPEPSEDGGGDGDDGEPPPPRSRAWDYDDDELPDDPEAAAAILLAQSGIGGNGNGHSNGNGNGHALVDNSDLLAGYGAMPSAAINVSEFSVDPATAITPSSYREVVFLSAKCRVIYDWARAHGWRRGDGSMSSFVLDVMTDHFENCWGKQIVVVEKGDVEITNPH